MKIAIEQFLTKQNINDDLFYSSLIAELEEIIEEELSKDIEEMNAELIDDCCLAIENMQNAFDGGKIEEYIAIKDVERIINQHNRKLRSIYIGAVACAAVAVLCAITSVKLTGQNEQSSLKLNGFLNDVFNINEETLTNTETTVTEQTTQAVTNEATTFINNETTAEISQATEGHISEEVTQPSLTKPVPHIYKIVACPPPGFRAEFSDVSKIDLSEFLVRIHYSDNTAKNVSIDECQVEIGKPDKNGKTKITITYKYFDTSIFVNICSEEEKNPVTLNSIYGTFNGGYNVESMKVFAVYSDGTEKEIPEGKYIVTREYLEDFEADVVIVEYSGCSFQFIPRV